MVTSIFHRRQVSVFTSCISIFIAVCYNLVRMGMPLHLDQSLKVVGFALFLLNFPLILAEKLSMRHVPRIIKDEYVILILSLLISCLVGLFSMLEGSPTLVILGVLCFGYNLFFYLKESDYRQWVFVPLILSIAAWLAIKVWNGGYLHPLFLEVLPFDDRIYIDTLFHMSIAQMIKTYHIPSTGLHGLPFYHYHFGSHYVFAALSALLKMRVVDFYQLGYPAIFLPLFLKVLVGVPITWFERKGRQYSTPIGMWLLLGAVMVGVFPLYKILSVAAGDWNMFIVSESYNVSLIWLFLIINVLVFGFNELEKSPIKNLPLIAIILILIFLLGLTKVSTFFVFMAGLFYLALRLKLYKERIILYSGIPLLMIALLCFWLVIDTQSGDGTVVDFMHFFETFVQAPFIPFILVFYFWCIVLIVLCSMHLQLRNFHPLANPPLFYRLLREIIMVVSIVGFVPGAILKIDGGSAGYFMDVCIWLSVAFLLVILPESVPVVKTLFQRIRQQARKRAAIIVFSIVLLSISLIAFRNLRKSITIFVKHNYTMRTWISGDKIGKFDFAESGKFVENLRSMKSLIPAMDSNLRINPDYQVLHKLYLMDSLDNARKSETVLLYGSMRGLEEKYPCYKYPFLIPALTGLVSSKGFVFENCYGTNYSFEYYKQKDLKDEDRTPVSRFPRQVIVNIDSGNVRLRPVTSKSAQ